MHRRLLLTLGFLLVLTIGGGIGVWVLVSRGASGCILGSDIHHVLTLDDFVMAHDQYTYRVLDGCRGMRVDITGMIGPIDDIVPGPRQCADGRSFTPKLVYALEADGWSYDGQAIAVYAAFVNLPTGPVALRARVEGTIQSCSVVYDNRTITVWYINVERIEPVVPKLKPTRISN